MHIETAWARRRELNELQLERLEAQLNDEIARYRDAIRGYTPEKMAKYGQPFLDGLEARLEEVRQLRAKPK